MRIGVDLGGTKIEAIALADDGHVAARHRVATPRSYDGTVEAIGALVEEVQRAAGGVGPVGVGIPGTLVRATRRVKNANSVWLNGQPLADDLEARTGRPVRLENDANCFALSEASDGAAAGAPVVFGVILGTGVGGGIVTGGALLIGINQVAGEWGHNSLPWITADELPGPPCYCGKRACIETFLSGPALEHDHAAHTGESLSSRDIVRRATSGDAGAAATMVRYRDRLARSLASIINILDPDVIVLGGGMSNIPGLAESVQPMLAPHVFSNSVVTRVVKNVHGDSSGVRGAAWLWPIGSSATLPAAIR